MIYVRTLYITQFLYNCVPCGVEVYPSDRGTLCQAGGFGGGVVGTVEGLLVRARGNLILPIETMVTHLGNPFVKQLLRLNLESRYRNQKSTQGRVRWRRCKNSYEGTVQVTANQSAHFNGNFEAISMLASF